jgi:hypothetical protein
MAMVDEKWGRNQQVAAYDSFAILRPSYGKQPHRMIRDTVDLAQLPHSAEQFLPFSANLFS